MIETTYPLRLKRYEFIPDTGGAGRQRGGLGVRRDIEFLDKSGALETQFDKFKVAPFGLFGGQSGATGKLYLNPDGPNGRELPSKTIGCKLRRGDVFSMWTQGGGGYGPCEERDREAIARDLREEKVSPQSAHGHYDYSESDQ
jgi:N-methylhydantoinase B